MNSIMVVAPHPDDETLGCGASLLRHIDNGDNVFWWIGTRISIEGGFTQKEISDRSVEIAEVSDMFSFAGRVEAGFETGSLEENPFKLVVDALSDSINKIKPEIIYSPFWNDVHSDHRVISRAVEVCCKTFRNPWTKTIRLYETLSETEQSFISGKDQYRPNTFIDVCDYIQKKIEIMKLYKSEIGKWPFPRSEEAIRVQAAFRGLSVGLDAAEAFMTVRDVI